MSRVVGLVSENNVDNTRDVRPLQDLSTDGLGLIYFRIYTYFSDICLLAATCWKSKTHAVSFVDS